MDNIKFDENKTFDIIPLGRVTVDLNPVDMYRPLDKSTTFRRYLGGSPANIAVGMARLGKKTGFIGTVSDDQFGTFVTDYFKNEHIDTSRLKRTCGGESMGLTFTEILSEKDSSILMYRKGVADLALDTGDIDEDYIKSTKILLVSGTSLAASPSREAALKAMLLAKKNGVFLVFDIDYRSYTWRSKEEMAVYYTLVGRSSDMIIGSREEFDLMQGFVSHDGDDEKTAKHFMSFGNKIIIIKHGKHGAVLFNDKGEKYTMTPFPVKKLKGFGGGDAFASAFIYAMLEGLSYKEALDFSNASASLLVASHSCSDAMPDVARIKEFIKENIEKYGEMTKKD